MPNDRETLMRLARELAALSPEERALVIDASVGTQLQHKPPPIGFKPPSVSIGKSWEGGTLRREEIYGDDGR